MEQRDAEAAAALAVHKDTKGVDHCKPERPKTETSGAFAQTSLRCGQKLNHSAAKNVRAFSYCWMPSLTITPRVSVFVLLCITFFSSLGQVSWRPSARSQRVNGKRKPRLASVESVDDHLCHLTLCLANKAIWAGVVTHGNVGVRHTLTAGTALKAGEFRFPSLIKHALRNLLPQLTKFIIDSHWTST